MVGKLSENRWTTRRKMIGQLLEKRRRMAREIVNKIIRKLVHAKADLKYRSTTHLLSYNPFSYILFTNRFNSQ